MSILEKDLRKIAKLENPQIDLVAMSLDYPEYRPFLNNKEFSEALNIHIDLANSMYDIKKTCATSTIHRNQLVHKMFMNYANIEYDIFIKKIDMLNMR